ncbi:MAG: PP2C family protein-serine/threonine phosphatase [Planctomycetota bacterium]
MSRPGQQPAVTSSDPAAVEAPPHPFAGMTVMDMSDSRRLPILMEMVAALSRATDARDVLHEFAVGFRKLYGPRGYVSLSTRGLKPDEYKITRLITDDIVHKLGEADPWKTASQLPIHRGGFFGHVIRTAYPQVVHHLNVRGDPVVGDALAGFGSMMAIPLFDNGEPLNWAITFREAAEGFTMDELEESVLRSNLGGTMVKNAIMTRQLRDAHAAIRHEVEQIARIQRALLPPSVPEIPGLGIGVHYETFDQAGGDMYALRPLRPIKSASLIQDDCCDPCGPWGILIADVSGHGPAAAVLMAMMRAIFDAYPREPEGPAEVLEHANRHLYAKRIEDRFVTALFAVYDPETRKLTYARAGHNPPVWMRPAGRDGWDFARLDDIGGLPLGIQEDVSYEQSTINLDPGQTLVLYTDGVTEAVSPAGRMFGVEGIEHSLTECTGEPECAIEHITSILRSHEDNVRPTDDQTLVVMRAL